MQKIAELILELRLATRRACMCEINDGNKKSTLTLKTKVLYLIRRELSTKEILAELNMAKTNLAFITREMDDEGLIVKSRNSLDRREVSYVITEKGEEYLRSRLEVIADNVAPLLTEPYDDAAELLQKAVIMLGGETTT